MASDERRLLLFLAVMTLTLFAVLAFGIASVQSDLADFRKRAEYDHNLVGMAATQASQNSLKTAQMIHEASWRLNQFISIKTAPESLGKVLRFDVLPEPYDTCVVMLVEYERGDKRAFVFDTAEACDEYAVQLKGEIDAWTVEERVSWIKANPDHPTVIEGRNMGVIHD